MSDSQTNKPINTPENKNEKIKEILIWVLLLLPPVIYIIFTVPWSKLTQGQQNQGPYNYQNHTLLNNASNSKPNHLEIDHPPVVGKNMQQATPPQKNLTWFDSLINKIKNFFKPTHIADGPDNGSRVIYSNALDDNEWHVKIEQMDQRLVLNLSFDQEMKNGYSLILDDAFGVVQQVKWLDSKHFQAEIIPQKEQFDKAFLTINPSDREQFFASEKGMVLPKNTKVFFKGPKIAFETTNQPKD